MEISAENTTINGIQREIKVKRAEAGTSYKLRVPWSSCL